MLPEHPQYQLLNISGCQTSDHALCTKSKSYLRDSNEDVLRNERFYV